MHRATRTANPRNFLLPYRRPTELSMRVTRRRAKLLGELCKGRHKKGGGEGKGEDWRMTIDIYPVSIYFCLLAGPESLFCTSTVGIIFAVDLA